MTRYIKNRAENPLNPSLHPFYKSEHLVGTLAVSLLLGTIWVNIILAKELNDGKTALIHVEVNVPFLKIRRAGLPDLRLGMQSLDLQPGAVADALTMLLRRNEKQLQMIVMPHGVDLQNQSSNVPAIINYPISLTVRGVNAPLDGFPGNDLSFIVNVIVPLPKLHHSTVLESPLIVKNKLLPILTGQGRKSNLCTFPIVSPVSIF